MTLRRLILCVFFSTLLFRPNVQGADEEGCPCATTDPVELVVPEMARRNNAPEDPPQSPTTPEQRKKGPSEALASPRAKVLIIGDSLGLCGFGKTLDTRLRKLPSVSAVYTYLACGTVPISWLKTGPLARAHTACGYWSIEGKSGEPPAELRDTYGMQHAKRPDSHVVPKIETLLEEHKPDILVIQNGTNLLSLFSDGKTILPARHDAQIRTYLNPLMRFLAEQAPTVKKIYWVGPPVSGRVTPEVQDFLLHHIAAYDCPFLNVIDTRTLIKYPYRNTMADKEHFVGKDMDTWAEAVFQRISKDLSSDLLTAEPLSRQKLLPAVFKAPSAPSSPPLARASKRPRVVIKAKLLAKSEPLTTDKILPYQESMVSFLYHVDEVLAGDYSESEIVIMHPAHIRLKPESLANYKIGASFEFELMDFEGSPWESIKRSEQTGHIELRPFIRKEDEARFPSLPH